MPSRERSPRLLIAISVGAAILAGCSSMQPTPMMPTYPAQVGRGGVPAAADNSCRQQAYQIAASTKQDNVNKEVAFTALGTIAGAVIGNQVHVSDGRPRYHYYGHRGRYGRYGRYGSHDLAGVGAVAGAATGAAVSQSGLQDPQQVYDITYNNCVQSYLNERY